MMKRSLLSYCIALFLTLLVTAGCGKSPDDLYSEAKALAADPDTIHDAIQALASFEQRFPDDPRVPEVLLSLASLLQANRDFTAAAQTYERLLDTYRDIPEVYKARFLLGYLYYDTLDNPDMAEQIFTSFIEAYPDSELTLSAQVLLENIDRPVEEWAVIRNLDNGMTDMDTDASPQE